MNALSSDKKALSVSMLAEGFSIRAVEQITGIHRDTVMRLGIRIGQACIKVADEPVNSAQSAVKVAIASEVKQKNEAKLKEHIERGLAFALPWHENELDYLAVVSMLPASEGQDPISYDAFRAKIEAFEKQFQRDGAITRRIPIEAGAIKT